MISDVVLDVFAAVAAVVVVACFSQFETLFFPSASTW